MDRKFWILIVTMILGGLGYSITSWSWINSTFITKDHFTTLIKRFDRADKRVDKRFDRIEDKLDHLLNKK